MLTFAFCTYNRANRLENLIAAMRDQECPQQFEILAINNNSRDETSKILAAAASQPGPRLRWVNETTQGIVAARNRALTEAIDSDILAFIDDDELPEPGLLKAAHHAITMEGAQCVGGRVSVDFGENKRPSWLGDNLLGFLAEVNYGDTAFWIQGEDTPVWTANVAYDMSIFRKNPQLRFDGRFDRKGEGIGGGEDIQMFRAILRAGHRIRYRPEMRVRHGVEEWKLRRSYLLKLHYEEGRKTGKYILPTFKNTFLGIPPFLVRQAAIQGLRTLAKSPQGQAALLRQTMTLTHSLGLIAGYMDRATPPQPTKRDRT
ncbi:glycosyltransferase [Rubrivivax gelatinosus]|uniref:Glycosyltransferase involved in cell wall biosynthesis n=1 Tax=Rubrivivax gelatinosus TaxID=28068 RepID=A0A4R2MQY1_RUBGE|nr:glycosyltransferase [Rubrivivax gelatinosus]MBK1686103.1 glycosyltransferase [Rubrivivax gelatinosus]TCP05596.1 glycosyltransferase involved in cell wall biosynthesis [Rubrivivax gelatinosus]